MFGALKARQLDSSESCPLTQDFESATDLGQTPSKKGTRAKIGQRIYYTLLHILVLSLLVIIWVREPSVSRLRPSDGVSWSPANKFVEFEVNGDNAVDHHKYSIYSGTPTVEQTQAWEKLVGPVFFNATREELERAGESAEDAVKVKKGGYLATVSVYHELHCLRQLRFYVFRDTYLPHLTEADEIYTRGHLDHCLEALRLTIMCHGNTGLYSFSWGDPSDYKPVTRTNATSMCAKWSSIEDWAYSRTIGMDPVLLRPSLKKP